MSKTKLPVVEVTLHGHAMSIETLAIIKKNGKCIIRRYGTHFRLLEEKINPLKNITELTVNTLAQFGIIKYDPDNKIYKTVDDVDFRLVKVAKAQ